MLHFPRQLENSPVEKEALNTIGDNICQATKLFPLTLGPVNRLECVGIPSGI